jgi:hypothetical protein
MSIPPPPSSEPPSSEPALTGSGKEGDASRAPSPDEGGFELVFDESAAPGGDGLGAEVPGDDESIAVAVDTELLVEDALSEPAPARAAGARPPAPPAPRTVAPPVPPPPPPMARPATVAPPADPVEAAPLESPSAEPSAVVASPAVDLSANGSAAVESAAERSAAAGADAEGGAPAPTTSAPSSPGLESPVDGQNARIAALRAEHDAGADPLRRAVLRYEIGHLAERRGADDAAVAEEHRAALAAAPEFRPPLFALTRIAERRRALHALGALYEAEAAVATNPIERASALLDEGVRLSGRPAEAERARALLEEALTLDSTSLAASLALEQHLHALGEADAAAKVAAARAAHVADPVMRGALLAEAASVREAEGDIAGAIASMREAAALPAGRWRALELWARIARRHGHTAALVEALEARAVLAGGAARGEDHGQGSGLFSVQRYDDAERAASEAAALWREAGRLRASTLADGVGAAQAYAQALALRPDSLLLRHERMLACELAGDLESTAAEARALLEVAGAGRQAAALHFRAAELALAQGDRAGARAALEAACAANPTGAAAAALLDDLDADDGAHAARLARHEARALDATLAAEVRAEAALRAGQIAADALRDASRARPLHALAASLASDATMVQREAWGAALRLGDAAWLVEAGAALLALPLDADERSAVLRAQIAALRATPEGAADADALLAAALADPAESSWAPEAARVHAATQRNRALLAAAHDALAVGISDAEAAAAHLAAAGRARALAGDDEGALRSLRAALVRAPGNRYAVGLLEELYRARGEAEAVVALLREAAASRQGDRAAETGLLLAGAAAEAAGDPVVAARTYLEAADGSDASVAPSHALARLAAKTRDAALAARAREGLAAVEAAGGAPSRGTLALAEHLLYAGGDPARAGELLRGLLGVPDIGPIAAATLALQPATFGDADAHVHALEALARTTGADDALARELGGVALAAEGTEARARAAACADRVLAQSPADRWALLARWRTAQPEARADALDALAAATSDERAARDFAFAALRARVLRAGGEALDDALLAANSLADAAPDALVAAVALDETTGPADDAALRLRAIEARVAHAGVSPHPGLRAALGRAQLADGRAADAYETLAAVVRANPDDLASVEALRVAAREAERWEDVVDACDRLAAVARAEFAIALREEAAAVVMDRLPDREEEAIARLRAVLDDGGMGRVTAYGRLHDLLAERGDAEALEALVGARIDATDDDAELVRLFYEQARIRRSRGDLEGALEALENLLMLEGEHVGGLALMVETAVSLERYADAVDALRALAQADVPPAQRRIARLGAADFLEAKLGDADGALAELRAAADAGLADGALYAKMADIAERAGRFDAATDALDQAAQRAAGPARAAIERRAALLYRDKLANPTGAAVTLGRALEAAPTDVAAGDLLAALLDDRARQGLSERFEAAVRAELRADATDPIALRKLRRAAVWRRDVVLERSVLALLAALGEATADERNLLLSLPAPGTKRPTGALADASLARLRGADATGGPAPLFALVAETLVEADRLEPARFGVGRAERVGPKDASPLRDELVALAAPFGVGVGELYVGGRDPWLVTAIPKDGEAPIWIVGSSVTAPLSPGVRFRVGRLAFALRAGLGPLLARDVSEWPTLALGLAAAVGAPLAAGGGGRAVEEAAAALGKAASRRVRKAVPDAARGVDGRADALAAAARALFFAASRAGLLIAADPLPALETSLPGGVSRASAQASEQARQLVQFWVSMDALAMRRELGLT